MLYGRLQQGNEIVGSVGGPTRYLYAGDYLGLHTAHEMRLYPLPVIHFAPVLFVEPADEAASGEARGIHGKVVFYGLQGQAAHGYELLQEARKPRIRHVVADRVEVRRAAHEAVGLGVSQVASKAPARKALAPRWIAKPPDHSKPTKRRSPTARIRRSLPWGFFMSGVIN